MDIYTDGSGKTGRYIYAIPEKKKVVISRLKGLTNNESEYMAVLKALRENKDDDIKIISDSQLIVNQLNKKYKIKEDRLRDLATKIWKLCEERSVTFSWVPREKNLAGRILG